MIITAARKKSNDPAQEALREKKALWNKEVSEFIDNVIHVKKMINGWPSKFHMERSKITDPLPKDPVTILGVLAGDFRDIATKGNDIIAEQIAYSQTRKKRKPTQMNLPLTQPPATTKPDLTQQLSLPNVASINYDEFLVSEGSNAFTRFVSKFKGIGTKERRIRLSLLKQAYQLYKLCSKFQVEILGKGKKNIDSANLALASIESTLTKFDANITNFGDELGKTVKKQTKPNAQEPTKPTREESPKQENITPNFEAYDKLFDDYNRNSMNFLNKDQALSNKFNDLYMKYKSTDVENERIIFAKQLLEIYNNLLLDLNNKNGTNVTTFDALVNTLSKKASNQIQVLAQDFLKKWIGKARHIISDETTESRKIAFDAAEEMRKLIDDIMDSLEKEFNPDVLNKKMNDVFGQFIRLQKSFKVLIPDLMIADPSSVGSGSNKENLEKLMEKKRLTQLTKKLLS